MNKLIKKIETPTDFSICIFQSQKTGRFAVTTYDIVSQKHEDAQWYATKEDAMAEAKDRAKGYRMNESKQTIKLNRKGLKQVIRESIKRMTENIELGDGVHAQYSFGDEDFMEVSIPLSVWRSKKGEEITNKMKGIGYFLYDSGQTDGGGKVVLTFKKKPVTQNLDEVFNPVYEPTPYMGCKNVHMIWHGEHADPELECNGFVCNYYTIENTLSIMAKEEGINPNNNEEFGNFVRENESYVCDLIHQYGRNKEEGYDELDEAITRALKKLLK